MRIYTSCKNLILVFIYAASALFLSCSDLQKQMYDIFGQDSPVIANLQIKQTTSTSITLESPNFSTKGNPDPTVEGYIGLKGTISVSDSVVSGSTEGPVSLSSGGYTFSGLSFGNTYEIVVVAKNSLGYSIGNIDQSTSEISPVLKGLTLSSTSTSSMTLAQPSFSTAGNPAPSANAYIGVPGTITQSNGVVIGVLQGPVDVSSGGCSFGGLSANSIYEIIVTAKNSAGYDVRSILQSTAPIAPVLSPLSMTSVGLTSIVLEQPALSTAGNETPTVWAYIGLPGTISVAADGTVSNNMTAAGQGPYDVSAGGCAFSNLADNTLYRIYVVAKNSVGCSVEMSDQITAPGISSFSLNGTTLTVDHSTHTITGNIPYYTNLDSLIATFTTTNGAVVKIPALGTTQISGSTINDFYSPVVYRVIGSTGVIRKYTVTVTNYGEVTTLALTEGAGAQLNSPRGLTSDGTDLYVANYWYSDILKIASPFSSTVCYAGVENVSGLLNGATLATSQFSYPRGICYKSGTGFYVVDTGNVKIRKISGSTVTTLNTSVISGGATDVAFNGGDMFVSAGKVYKNPGTTADFESDALDSRGIVYYGSYLYVTSNSCIYKMNTADGSYETFAGDSAAIGSVDGVGSSARFHGIMYITVIGADLYVTEYTAIRKISLTSPYRVTTIAGGSAGTADGLGPVATFKTPMGITSIGNVLYVVDSGSNSIRKIE